MARRSPTLADLEGRVAIVTGSNSGVGLETARGLARAGATVVMTARSEARGQAASDDVAASTGSDALHDGRLDLSSVRSIRRFADEVLERHDHIDILVLNAGGIVGDRRETEDGFEQMFGVNHLGHFLLARLLTERLVASAPARVVVVSSIAHRWAIGGLDFDDLQARQRFRSWQAYGRSKLANVLFASELARRLEGSGVQVNAVHPGNINSRFGADGDTGVLGRLIEVAGPYLLRTPEVGARGSLLLAGSDRAPYAESTGDYYSKTRRRRPSRAARDRAAAERLWDTSEKLLAELGVLP